MSYNVNLLTRVGLLTLLLLQPQIGLSSDKQTLVRMDTNMGSMTIALFDSEAPITTSNFKSYIEDGFYEGTIFHRVIKGFMIQGGGFGEKLTGKQTKAPIKNEAKSTVPNKRGTIAMARTQVPDSATSQFFINLVDNHFLNKSAAQAGYAVFGEVIDGMDVVDKIGMTKTGRRNRMADVPVDPIIIQSVSIIEETPKT